MRVKPATEWMKGQHIGRSAPLIMISANSAWNIANFRSGLIRSLLQEGYAVVAVAPEDGNSQRIRELGAQFLPIDISSSGTSVFKDAFLVLDYLKAMRKLRPDALLGFTVKPNIYGSLAASLLGVRTINNVSGLGTAFIRQGPLTWLVSWLYRVALHRSAKVFFQNSADLQLFLEKGLVRRDQAKLIPGSGVDLARFRAAAPAASAERPFRFLLVARLLWDKGIAEYVEAARILHSAWPDARFQILGFAGADNRTAVPIGEIERWRGDGNLEYLGETDDVRPFIEQADCIVLPSYREGLPRSLLEASAMERPVIATDVPGCRDAVADGETGFLCEVRSAASLADAMQRMLSLPAGRRLEMGRQGRLKVERAFDETLVRNAYIEALKE